MTSPLRLAVDLPFEEAIAWAKARVAVLPETYYDELPALVRGRAFTVSGLASLDQIQSVLDSLTKGIEQGTTFRAWKGWAEQQPWALPPGRLETVYRTAIQTHYNAGRTQQQRLNKARRPYYLWDAINDSRTRPDHAAMDGHIAPIDDPIWQRWSAPAGFNCRCTRIAITEKQAKARGYPTVDPGVEPDKGFGYEALDGQDAALTRLIEKRKSRCAEYGFAGRSSECHGKAAELLARLKRALDNPQPLGPPLSPPDKERFSAWAAQVLGDGYQGTHNAQLVGYLPDWVLASKAVQALAPESSDIRISDYQLKHANRETKQNRDAALPVPVLEKLPDYIERASWFFDDKHNNLLAAFYFRDGDKLGKAAVQLNFKRRAGSQSAHAIKTAGVVSVWDIFAPGIHEILPW
jgi:SPP1 gp7 family putative phage head morphogenesis protein